MCVCGCLRGVRRGLAGKKCCPNTTRPMPQDLIPVHWLLLLLYACCCCWVSMLTAAAMALEGVAADEWVAFDRVLIVRDLFTGGTRSFTSSSDAQEFRAAVYTHYGEGVVRHRAGQGRTVLALPNCEGVLCQCGRGPQETLACCMPPALPCVPAHLFVSYRVMRAHTQACRAPPSPGMCRG